MKDTKRITLITLDRIPGQHRTKWAVKSIRTGYSEVFECEEDARTYILMHTNEPVSLLPPLYEENKYNG